MINGTKRSRESLTSWSCGVSYSKKLSDGLVGDVIQNRNPLVLRIFKVDNWNGSEN